MLCYGSVIPGEIASLGNPLGGAYVMVNKPAGV